MDFDKDERGDVTAFVLLDFRVAAGQTFGLLRIAYAQTPEEIDALRPKARPPHALQLTITAARAEAMARDLLALSAELRTPPTQAKPN